MTFSADYPQTTPAHHLNRCTPTALCGKWTETVETCSHTYQSYQDPVPAVDNLSTLLTINAHSVDIFVLWKAVESRASFALSGPPGTTFPQSYYFY